METPEEYRVDLANIYCNDCLGNPERRVMYLPLAHQNLNEVITNTESKELRALGAEFRRHCFRRECTEAQKNLNSIRKLV